MTKKIGILILNYLAFEDTIECVDSLEKQIFQNFEILIVDNGSTNESYQILANKFKNHGKVSVILSENNLGFAKGNNLGIRYLKEKGLEQILVVNGDTLFEDPYFLEGISKVKYDSSIAMIGTKIICKDGKNQNPVPVTITNYKTLFKTWLELQALKFTLKTNIYSFLKKKLNFNENELEQQDDLFPEILNPEQQMLHGAAILFTENYLDKYIGFYPETFLYFEEDFLSLICRKFNVKQLYIPYLSIYHKEDASSNLMNDNDSKKSYLFKINTSIRNVFLMYKSLKLSKEELQKRMYR